jgi:hypothetical protein
MGGSRLMNVMQMLRRQIVLDLSVSMGTRLFSHGFSQLCEHSCAYKAYMLTYRIYANNRHRSRSRSRLWLVVRYVNDNN